MSPVNSSFSVSSASPSSIPAANKAGQAESGKKEDFFALLSARQANNPRPAASLPRGNSGAVATQNRIDQARDDNQSRDCKGAGTKQ